MKEMDNDKWLKNLFSEQPEKIPSFRFENSLMQRIDAMEREKVAIRERKNKKTELLVSVLATVAALVTIVVLFVSCGWSELFLTSWNRVKLLFTGMPVNPMVVASISAVFFVLIGDLFIRKYLSKP